MPVQENVQGERVPCGARQRHHEVGGFRSTASLMRRRLTHSNNFDNLAPAAVVLVRLWCLLAKAPYRDEKEVPL